MSTTVIILLIIILVLAFILIPFMRDLYRDKMDLKDNPINKKFEEVITIINDCLLDGTGNAVLFDDDKRLMNLGSDVMRNYHIQFYYSTGHLRITLRYKYLQKELNFSKTYYNVRNVTVYQQQGIGKDFVQLCREKIEEHQEKVGEELTNPAFQTGTEVHSKKDPLGVVEEMYSGMSRNQRLSAVNFVYIIARSSGNDESKVMRCPVFGQFIAILSVSWKDCKSYLTANGKERVYEDLKNIDKQVGPSLILTALSVVQYFGHNDESVCSRMEDTFFESFEKIGYSEQQLEATIEKLALMQKMFGG